MVSRKGEPRGGARDRHSVRIDFHPELIAELSALYSVSP